MAGPENKGSFQAKIDREHDDLRVMLGKVHKMLVDRTVSASEMAEKLEECSKVITTHFEEEEHGGFFDGVIAQAPRYVHETDVLREEHVQLLEDFDAVRRLAAGLQGSEEWWKQLEVAFHGFSKEMMRHEHKENELLQNAFEQDVGSGD